MKPPWLWTIPSEVESPRPVPLPMSLVVKKGSKILSRTCAGMPDPVSATEIDQVGARLAPGIMRQRGLVDDRFSIRMVSCRRPASRPARSRRG